MDRCGSSSECTSGKVCVANGCMPDQSPKFTCQGQGIQDDCNTGSICLNHNCFIGCTLVPDSCTLNEVGLNVCKAVETTTGTFHVCGSSTSVGTECDVSIGEACSSGKVCIDGICR